MKASLWPKLLVTAGLTYSLAKLQYTGKIANLTKQVERAEQQLQAAENSEQDTRQRLIKAWENNRQHFWQKLEDSRSKLSKLQSNHAKLTRNLEESRRLENESKRELQKSINLEESHHLEQAFYEELRIALKGADVVIEETMLRKIAEADFKKTLDPRGSQIQQIEKLQNFLLEQYGFRVYIEYPVFGTRAIIFMPPEAPWWRLEMARIDIDVLDPHRYTHSVRKYRRHYLYEPLKSMYEKWKLKVVDEQLGQLLKVLLQALDDNLEGLMGGKKVENWETPDDLIKLLTERVQEKYGRALYIVDEDHKTLYGGYYTKKPLYIQEYYQLPILRYRITEPTLGRRIKTFLRY